MDKITILNSVVCDAEADIETPLTLTQAHKDALERCEAAGGKKRLRVLASSETGAFDATIDTLSGSIDGTNYVILQAFSGLQITTAGEQKATNPLLMEITAPLTGFAKLRLDVTAANVDGSNLMTLLAEIFISTLGN